MPKEHEIFSETANKCLGLGCMAARARAARTYKDDAGVVHTVTTQEPNEHFSTCCSLLDVPESCRHMCTFDGYNTSAIQSSLTFSFPCPATALSQIQFCAARGVDHSQCCQSAGISPQCLLFCDQRPDQSNELSFSHLQCLDRFDSMKDCFIEYAITEYYREKQSAHDSLDKSYQT
ncbi:DB module [Teladorsagia circumcincta]|uniref:DB module n=1 Tax=Teladorsagia circumcincta TaxID=45464 RepID=A0A2G9UL34_TELCI|nr:DB module [Teladorsagia circumcincta]